MNRLVLGTLCILLLSAPSAIAGDSGKTKNGRGSAAAPAPPTVRVAQERVQVAQNRRGDTNIYFSVDHVRVLRGHYAPRYRRLPPGLQKKYARTGQLPPGWQKKMEPLPVAIERDLPPLPVGYRRGVIDGHAIVYSSRAGTIIDVAVLF
jgi:hypothetical protein